MLVAVLREIVCVGCVESCSEQRTVHKYYWLKLLKNELSSTAYYKLMGSVQKLGREVPCAGLNYLFCYWN